MQDTNSQCVVVLGTGGTIAGTSTVGGDPGRYVAARLGVAELIAAVPGVAARLEHEQVAQLDSKDMDFHIWRELALCIERHLVRPEVAGVVVTHGTDTLEETAYFLHRLLGPVKPVVFAAAMRPATSPEADGPGNLFDAIKLARHHTAAGVMVAMGGTVFAADSVRKSHPTRIRAFGAADLGPVARWREDHVLTQLRPWPLESDPVGMAALPMNAAEWPRVEIVTSHAGATGWLVDALCAAGVEGLAVATTGNGTLHRNLEAALLRAQAGGVQVLRSTRCIEGGVVARADDALPAAGMLTPAQARVELMLRLMAAKRR